MNEQNSYVYVSEEKTPARSFNTVETVFAWICFAIGYAFCRVFPASANPFGGFLFIITLFVVTAVILKIKGARLTGMPLAAGISALLMGTSLLFSANLFIHFFAYAYCLGAYGYFLYTAFGNAAEQGLNDLLFIDFFKALLIAPFRSFIALFRGVFSGKSQVGGKTLLKIIAGIGVAIVPTVIIISLLSYDSGFSDLLMDIFDFGFSDVLSHIGSLILGIPIGMYVYGLFISSIDRKCDGIWTAQTCRETSAKIKIAPVISVLSAVFPILAVYVVFFISQWKYYISGFVGVLPDATTYAEYAREGFFQLCTVSFINFLIIGAIGFFTRRKTEKPSVLQRLLTIVLSLFTLVLIATAVAKMVLYIDVYGLTPKRVYATWFMAVLALLFILMIIKQFALRLRAIAISAVIVICSFAALSFANTDALIVEYNADRYLDGSIDSFDADAMSELGDAAIHSMVRLAMTLDKKHGSDLLNYNNDKGSMDAYEYYEYTELCNYLYNLAKWRETDVWSLTLPQLQADAALKECGLDEKIAQWKKEEAEEAAGEEAENRDEDFYYYDY